MRQKVIAFEAANSFVKVFSEGRSVVYPNTVTDASKESFQFSEDGRNENTVYTIKGQRYNVGQTLRYSTSSSDSVGRYGSDQYYIESLIAISHFVSDGSSVKVVTGIPSVHYDDKEEATRLIKDSLKGTHTITVNDEEMTFTVSDVLVTLQPLATFFFAAVNENGIESPEMLARFEESETLIIDIGWGTTDIAVCAGFGLNSYFTVDTSMKWAYETIIERMKDKARKEKRKLASARIKPLDVEKHARKHNKVYKHANETYDFKDIYAEVMEITAKKIYTEVNAIRGIDQFTTVLLTGGGAMAMLTDLEKLLQNPRTGEFYDNVYIMDGLQTANVKGYYVFAKYLHQTV